MEEIWKDIPGYEGRYQASNQGRVRSVDRRVRLVVHGIETTRFAKGQILRPGPCQSRHLSVAVGKGNSKHVHALVALAFYGPPPPGHEVLHLNHDPKDNRVKNLRYGTRGENIAMDYAVGTRKVNPKLIGARWRAREKLFEDLL